MPDAASPRLEASPLLRVAHVRRVHGVRGEVRVQALGGDLQRFTPGTALITESVGRRLTVRTARGLDGDDVLLSFDEVPDREDAASIAGDYLCVAPSQARQLGADEWFVWQLVGLHAVTRAGDQLGVVRDVEEQPASDVLVVGGTHGEQRFPMVREWVTGVDLDAGVVVVTPWPEAED